MAQLNRTTVGAPAAPISPTAPPSEAVRRFTVFSSLADPTYRWFWFSMLFSFFGMQTGQVARQWLVFADLVGVPAVLTFGGAVTVVVTLLACSTSTLRRLS